MKRLFKDKQGNNLYLTFRDIYDEEELNKAIKENIDIIAFSFTTKEHIKGKYQLQGKKFDVPEGYKYKSGQFNFYSKDFSCYCSFCFYKKDLEIDFTRYRYKNRPYEYKKCNK